MSSMDAGKLDKSFSAFSVNSDLQYIGNGKIPPDQPMEGDVQIICFSESLDDATLHFQIIRLQKQMYVWIGHNNAKLGHLYAAATTRPNNTVSVTPLLGGSSDNIGSGMSRRIVLRTGLNVVVACNIPKDSPMLEATAERKLVDKLKSLGYTNTGLERTSC